MLFCADNFVWKRYFSVFLYSFYCDYYFLHHEYKQFDPHSEIVSAPSFFNLQVELLIEGMTGADLCQDYRFHEERGYKDTYFSQVSTFTL